MGQVNVNTPGEGGTAPAPASDGSGYGFILGIIVAILVIALIVWLLVFNQPATDTTDDGTTLPSAHHLIYRA